MRRGTKNEEEGADQQSLPAKASPELQVVFEDSQDPRDPQNWSWPRKIGQVALITSSTMYAGIGSAVLEGGNADLMRQFNISSVVATFANSIFVIGFAFGPQIFGPASEILGRKWPLVGGLFLSSIFAIQCATAQNLATIIIGRFLSGLFASAPYAIGGGCFHDFLDPIHVQGGIAFFATATAGGPALGPILGAGLATTSSTYGWRWSGWFLTASGVLITILLVVFMDESYSPAVLSNIAKERRKTTGEDGWWSELDLVSVTPRIILVQYILRPVKMLMVEPMLLVISIYMSFVYGLLYMLMSAIPIIYGEMRGMSPFQATLPLLSVFIGILFGGILIFLDMARYARMLKRKGEVSLPEQRFVPMGLGALLLPIGLFWFAFTGPAQVGSIWPSIIALAFAMCGMVLIFECGIIYLIDMYRSFANSAIAANTLMRSIVGGTFPLFTPAMIHRLGYSSTWAMALLAFIATALAIIPFVFFHFGARIRSMSKFTFKL